jgi:hypothetical protein
MSEIEIESYNYQNNVDVNYWQHYLNRKLTDDEKYILDSTLNEANINKSLENIYCFGQTLNLHIPILTNLDGNCIFECLKYFGICDDIDLFRKELAILMLLYRNEKYFIPNQELTLEELFEIRNEIPYVYCTKKQKVYKYNYDAMCIDIATSHAWTRIDTESILTFVSIIFNLKILIVHDNENIYITEICTSSDKDTKTIHLGLIREIHYVPLDYMDSNKTDYVCLKYKNNLKKFHKWARKMAYSLGRVTFKPA